MNISTNFLPPQYHLKQRQFLLNLFPEFGINILKNNFQVDGTRAKEKEQNVKYIDHKESYTFKLAELIEMDRIQLSVISADQTECITVFIEQEMELAILHNMTYYENCAKEGLIRPGGGSILLRFILNYLINNKRKYKINRIVLTDNSFLACNNCDDNVKLARLRFITHGETWYMKYGFMPYDAEKNKPDEQLKKYVIQNNKKISQLKTNELPILKLSKNVKNLNVAELKRLIDKYSSFGDFITKLSQEYNKYCCLLVHILKELYDPVIGKKLMDFYKKPFYLDI